MAATTLELSTNRQLSFAVYGDKNGSPVYYMHGFYGSRVEALLAAEAAEKSGVQLIAADRPGVGESTPEPGRTLQTWARNIGELADHLGHDRFSILGVSGGGPYALSCCHELPDRISTMALCCSLAPLSLNGRFNHLPLKYRAALWSHRYFNIGLVFCNYLLYSGARKIPGALLEIISRQLSASDKNILRKPAVRDILVDSLTEASRQGPLYGEQELTIFGADWSRFLTGIKASVDIWHGGQDKVVPVALAHQLHASLQQSKLHIIPDQGHFSLPILHAENIFRSLLGK